MVKLLCHSTKLKINTFGKKNCQIEARSKMQLFTLSAVILSNALQTVNTRDSTASLVSPDTEYSLAGATHLTPDTFRAKR